MQNINLEFRTVKDLVDHLEESQYTYKQTIIPKGNITTKYELRNSKIDLLKPHSKTSGSTGIPVIVQKTNMSIMWHSATNIRDLKWRKWDLQLRIVVILAKIKEDKINGNFYEKKLDTMVNLQKYLETIQPHYIYTYPTIIQELDLTKLINLIDIKTTGEIGGTCYSSEETGTIALQCFEYPENYHIMENIIVESHPKYGILVTDLTNPIINRYALGDVIELGTELCKCGRTLPVIKKIHGRIRNMLVLPNGDKIWPTIGEPRFLLTTNKIIRHQMIQKTLYDLELRLQVNELLTKEEENQLLNLVYKTLEYDHLICKIVYVDGFPEGKFECFRCEI